MVDPTTGPVMLVRALRGRGAAGRVVHVVPLPGGTGTSGLLGTRCGTSLVGDEVEMVEPGVGVPCTGCLLDRDTVVHPATPRQRTLIAGEPYGVPLPWPGGVRLITGTLALPPSTTPCGSPRWEQLPADPSLAGCREIDIFSAVHTTLHAAADAEGGCGT